MYRIIGADNKEYGPISADQLRQWIAEGRANAQTQVLAEGTTQWKPLSDFPELAAMLPGPPPAAAAAPGMPPIPMAHLPMANANALTEVSPPATALIILAILHFLWVVFSIVVRFALASLFSASQMPNQPFADMFSGTLGWISNILGIFLALLIFLGGLKMKRLENYGLAMSASIVALLPCSACCIVGLPIGIWALVILSKPEVKSSFR
jgi:hypothetical protein